MKKLLLQIWSWSCVACCISEGNVNTLTKLDDYFTYYKILGFKFSWISFIYLLTSYQMKSLLTKYVPTAQLSCIEKLTAVYWTFCIVINMEMCISLSNRIEMVCCPPMALHFIMPARQQDIKFNPYLIRMSCLWFPLSNLVPLKPIKWNLYVKLRDHKWKIKFDFWHDHFFHSVVIPLICRKIVGCFLFPLNKLGSP